MFESNDSSGNDRIAESGSGQDTPRDALGDSSSGCSEDAGGSPVSVGDRGAGSRQLCCRAVGAGG